MAKSESSKKVTGKAKKHISGFREFISKGNVIDLAVGVIIGGAFGKIVSSIVDDILMPLIGIVLGGIDFTSFEHWDYGMLGSSVGWMKLQLYSL